MVILIVYDNGIEFLRLHFKTMEEAIEMEEELSNYTTRIFIEEDC